jgi:hypothetical protein
MNKTANLLLVAMCTGLILAGCQPAQPTPTSTIDSSQNVGGSIAIEENKDVNASMNITETLDGATKATDSAMDSATKALDDANKALTENSAYLTPEAKKAMEDANKAMVEANASAGAALEDANKAMIEAKAAMEASASASSGN